MTLRSPLIQLFLRILHRPVEIDPYCIPLDKYDPVRVRLSNPAARASLDISLTGNFKMGRGGFVEQSWKSGSSTGRKRFSNRTEIFRAGAVLERGFGAIADLQFGVDPFHVGPDRFQSQVHFFGNFLINETRRQKL